MDAKDHIRTIELVQSAERGEVSQIAKIELRQSSWGMKHNELFIEVCVYDDHFADGWSYGPMGTIDRVAGLSIAVELLERFGYEDLAKQVKISPRVIMSEDGGML